METKTKKIWLYYSLAFLISAGVILTIFIITDIYPFGNRTLIFNDAYYQYISFFDYYRNLMTGKENFFYSFKLYLGNSVSGLYAYYLASPFNLLYLLFPQSQTVMAFHFVYLLKIGFCGLSAAVFFRYTSKPDIVALIFSTGYALCSYNIAFGFCYMWIDGVIMLPIIALGIQRIIGGKSPAVYLLSLAIVIISNFYIGFIICCFSVLFFIYSFILGKTNTQRQNLSRVGSYAISSVLAGGIPCVLLFPSVISISSGSSSALSNIKDFTYPLAVRIIELLHLTGKLSVKAALLIWMIWICAIAGVLLFVLLSKKCSKTTRIVGGIIVVTVIAVFYILVERPVKVHEFEITTDSFINLFFGSVPDGESYDYSPLIFTGLIPAVFAVLYFFNPEFTKKEKLAAILFLTTLVLSFLFYIPNLVWHGLQKNNCFNYRYSFIFCFFVIYLGERTFRKRDNIPARHVITVVLAFLGCCICALLWNNFSIAEAVTGILSLMICSVFLLTKQEKHRAEFALLCVSVIALATSGYTTLDLEAGHGKKATRLQEIISNGNSIIESIKNTDSSFYRIRNYDGFLNPNDSLQFDYNGGSAFTSDGNVAEADFCSENGIRTSSNKRVEYDESATRALDSLLGFKYCISKNGYADYEKISENIYTNPYALPLCFVTGKNTATSGQTDSVNVFDNLNSIWAELTPSIGDIYNSVGVVLTKTDEKTIQASLICDGTDPLYARMPSDDVSSVEVQVNGETVKEEKEPYLLESLYLGTFVSGDKVMVIWHFSQNVATETAVDCIYTESTEKLQQATDSLKSTFCETSVLSDSHIFTDTILEESGTLVSSIPYDKGWKITVDGTETEGYVAVGAFTAVDLSAGEHHIEFHYIPTGFSTGLTLTIISLAGSAVFLIIGKKRRLC